MPWDKTKYPIIQAPMAGGATTPELIAAVSNGGGLGSLGAGYLSAADIKQAIAKIRQLTDKPFAVNLFVPEPHAATSQQMQTACQAINQCSQTLHHEVTPVQAPYATAFNDQVAVLLAEKIPVMSFTFGIPDINIIKQFKANKTFMIGTATTLAEAEALQENQVDAIVAQSSEAGGHRGSFLDSAENSLAPLNTLLHQLAEAIDIPIIASGGIMDGQTIAQCLQAGASAAQLGSAFLCCDESGIPAAYKQLLLNQTKDNTVLTRAFSGKLARGVSNQFTQCMQTKTDTILDYPIQNKLTSTMRKIAKQQSNTEYMSLWAGQSVHKASALSAQALFTKLINESI
ncbi:MAG: nitronate monooxygenase [Coxiellaceae bacterium]|nr:nitronate monooxygenase [Coxiellaceae bacterium]